jgi:hypothetical protein
MTLRTARGIKEQKPVKQTIYLNPTATAYTDWCEACLGGFDEYGGSIGHQGAVVHGSLRQEVDVGFVTCRRGHRLVVRRVARPLALQPA